MESESRLPSNPSELIRLAIQELEKYENADGFKIDMDNWVTLKTPKKPYCTVCLAGAVMFDRLGADN